MRRTAGLLALLLAAGLTAGAVPSEAAGGRPAPGEPAPPFTLPDLEGRPVGLSSLSGQVVGLHFFALWCEPCLEGLTAIERAHLRHGARGYRPLLIAVAHRQEPDRLKAFARRRGLDIPVLLDGEGAVEKLYGVGGLPKNILVGRDGVIRSVEGAIPASFQEQVARLVSEKKP